MTGILWHRTMTTGPGNSPSKSRQPGPADLERILSIHCPGCGRRSHRARMTTEAPGRYEVQITDLSAPNADVWQLHTAKLGGPTVEDLLRGECEATDLTAHNVGWTSSQSALTGSWESPHYRCGYCAVDLDVDHAAVERALLAGDRRIVSNRVLDR